MKTNKRLLELLIYNTKKKACAALLWSKTLELGRWALDDRLRRRWHKALIVVAVTPIRRSS